MECIGIERLNESKPLNYGSLNCGIGFYFIVTITTGLVYLLTGKDMHSQARLIFKAVLTVNSVVSGMNLIWFLVRASWMTVAIAALTGSVKRSVVMRTLLLASAK